CSTPFGISYEFAPPHICRWLYRGRAQRLSASQMNSRVKAVRGTSRYSGCSTPGGISYEFASTPDGGARLPSRAQRLSASQMNSQGLIRPAALAHRVLNAWRHLI